mmetsp:Transcript_15824/g.28446  ORF Transcript_15824/g.28446 Transcript_15824/m.28446 type:complete len:576 (-) Transcript_15824:194-1921(-)|eukprot:CAMPEP_0196143228 /NCGR_PEP_ID=MMETSP0910-20130528/12930_1 /TAXON_ID=49265 /ORGANISM="Thalassiosira rotula, Strain GSO102" /LENGTH=575 /DNA_ID=CAMNT_0041404647 /DNA_START=88 /DNA_END=1815 /DNA_ORIENTATION=+
MDSSNSQPLLPRPTRRTDVISPHFPAEGIDYLSGNRAGIIFDMSVEPNGTMVALASGISVPLPASIATVKPSSELETTSEISSEMTLNQVASSISTSYGSKWSMSLPVSTRLGAEVGGTRDSSLRWARSRMSSSHRYAVSSKFSYNFVEVATQPPVSAVLSIDFLRAFAILPSGAWESFTEADRGAYAGFLATYGTHYVKAAKFGGSYETLVVAEACALVLAEQRGSSLVDCVSTKLSLIFSEILGIDSEVSSVKSCQGLTTSGLAVDAWESSTVKSTQIWRGGSFDEADSLELDSISTWIEGVKRNPRSFPTQLASIPDLFRELLGAYDWGEEYCLPCQTLKGLNLDKEAMGAKVRNLDFAFEELLLKAKEEKLEQEVCKLTCGACGRVAPVEGCTCPTPSAVSCSSEGGGDLMEVVIASIEMDMDKPWNPFQSQNLRLFTSGLGSPYDGKEYGGEGRSVSVDVGTTLIQQKGDTVYIEVVDDPLNVGLKNCVGSADFPLELVGTGKSVDLNGPCTRSNNPLNTGRVGKNPVVLIDGSFKYPNCCECTIQENAASGHTISLFLLMLLVTCAVFA